MDSTGSGVLVWCEIRFWCPQESLDGAKSGAALAAELQWAAMTELDPKTGPPVLALEDRPIPEVCTASQSAASNLGAIPNPTLVPLNSLQHCSADALTGAAGGGSFPLGSRGGGRNWLGRPACWARCAVR